MWQDVIGHFVDQYFVYAKYLYEVLTLASLYGLGVIERLS